MPPKLHGIHGVDGMKVDFRYLGKTRGGCMPPGLQSRARVTCRRQDDGLDVEAFLVETRPFRNGR